MGRKWPLKGEMAPVRWIVVGIEEIPLKYNGEGTEIPNLICILYKRPAL